MPLGVKKVWGGFLYNILIKEASVNVQKQSKVCVDQKPNIINKIVIIFPPLTQNIKRVGIYYELSLSLEITNKLSFSHIR